MWCGVSHSDIGRSRLICDHMAKVKPSAFLPLELGYIPSMSFIKFQ